MKSKVGKFRRSLLVYGLILVFGAAASGCAGWQKHPWTTGDKITTGVLVAAIAADVATTVHGINNGLEERNPIFGGSPDTFTIIIPNVLLTGLAIWVMQYMTSDERKIMWIPAMFRGAVAIHNYKLINED